MGALRRVYPNGDLELALTIRAFAIAAGQIHLWVGGGIVWDSDPGEEIEESWVKARPLLALVGATQQTFSRYGALMLLALAVTGRGVVDPGEPVVHADDEAVLRGRAAFETLRVYDGEPFRLEEHLDRLAASAARIDLPATDRPELERLGAAALEAAQAPNAVLRFLWTAGREDGDPLGAALVSAIPDSIEEWRARGIRLVSLLGVRADVPWLLGGVKATSYAVNMAADAEAKRRGADDAVFVDPAGVVLEGPVTNVWWRCGDTLYTPGLDLGVLAGVTRGVLIAAAPRFGYRVEEGVFTLADVASADEVFTSSSVREVLPVVELDGDQVGDGAPGPAARTLQEALRQLARA